LRGTDNDLSITLGEIDRSMKERHSAPCEL